MSQSEQKNKQAICNRRQFFSLFLNEAAVYYQSVRNGKPIFQLNNLHEMPEALFNQIYPISNPEFRFTVDEGFLWAQRKYSDNREQLFAIESVHYYLFQQFKGSDTILQIANKAARKLKWEHQQAYQFTRDLFLYLVQHQVCVPRDPIENLNVEPEE